VITTQVIDTLCWYLADVHDTNYIIITVFKAILPVAVLMFNLVVVFKVRRAATNAAANLGVQPHHHPSTSSSSAVPTVMLVATSLIYVLLYSLSASLFVACRLFAHAGEYNTPVLDVLSKSFLVTAGLTYLVFSYNFYIYVITGKKFRYELHKLFCCCLSSSSSAAVTAAFTDEAEVTIRVHSN